jgi:hypothetical protein
MATLDREGFRPPTIQAIARVVADNEAAMSLASTRWREIERWSDFVPRRPCFPARWSFLSFLHDFGKQSRAGERCRGQEEDELIGGHSAEVIWLNLRKIQMAIGPLVRAPAVMVPG